MASCSTVGETAGCLAADKKKMEMLLAVWMWCFCYLDSSFDAELRMSETSHFSENQKNG